MLFRSRIRRADHDLDERGIRPLPIHPVLAAAFPILTLYANNIGQVPLGQIVRPLFLAHTASLSVWIVAALIARSVRKGAFAATVLVLGFFTYGHAADLMAAQFRPLALPLCVLAATAVLVALFRSKGSLTQATIAANLASLVLVAPSVVDIAASMNAEITARAAVNPATAGPNRAPQQSATSRSHRVAPVEPPKRLAPAEAARLRDIYYIILDAYGRADSLRAFYGFDNSRFIRALEDRGFYVASRSRSNYDQTGLCLASALNMTYLDPLIRDAGLGPTDLDALEETQDANRTAAFLRRRGYHYVFISSGAGQVRGDTADLRLGAGSRENEFEGQLLQLTPGSLDEASHRRTYNQYRSRILAGFRDLDSVASLPYPKFVLAHIGAPHPPFVFGAAGQPVYPNGPLSGADASWLLRDITKDQYRAGYTAQLQYVNRRAIEAIDSILRLTRAARRPKPIIIVQGDHGSRMNLDWDSMEKSDLREPFSILNAYLVPGAVRQRLYASITPVNSFRILFAGLFGANSERLPDRSFYSTAREPLRFSEVTRLIPSMPGTRAAASAR